MIECLIFPGTANHKGTMMPLSLWGTLTKKPYSYSWFIFPFICIDLSDCRNHSYIKAELTTFVLAQMKFTKCSFVSHSYASLSPHSRPYSLVGAMWQQWIFLVTAVWLPLLTRDKGSGRIFTAIYLPLISLQPFCLPAFYLLSRNPSVGTPETEASSFVKTNRYKQEASHCITVT